MSTRESLSKDTQSRRWELLGSSLCATVCREWGAGDAGVAGDSEGGIEGERPRQRQEGSPGERHWCVWGSVHAWHMRADAHTPGQAGRPECGSITA